MLASEAAVEKFGLKPRAKIISMAVAGVDPTIMLTGPVPASQQALAKAGLTVDEMDAVEINEAFASVALGCGRALGLNFEKTNVYGGAIANGHPLGASGAKLMTTLLNVLERNGGRYGLQTMCIGFGQATATIIDRDV
jgi:acetyl-CoA C-acetyltransferase